MTTLALIIAILLVIGIPLVCVAQAEHSYQSEAWCNEYLLDYRDLVQHNPRVLGQGDRQNIDKVSSQMIADGEGRHIAGRWWRTNEPEPKPDEKYTDYFA
jgi:hypothetical protein